MDIAELLALSSVSLHLSINTVETLRPPRNLRFDASFLQLVSQDLAHLSYISFTGRSPSSDQSSDFAIFIRLQIAESQVLQLPPQLPHPQPVCERSIDIHRLLSYPLLFLRCQCLQGAHIMQPVGQLNEHHANILRHSHKHLAQALHLGIAFSDLLKPGGLHLRRYFVQSRHSLDQLCHLRAKTTFNLRERNPAVLRHVMEQCSSNRGFIELKVSYNHSYLHRVRYKRLT